MLKVAVVLCMVVLAVEGYYTYRFYADLPAASGVPPAAPDTAVSETNAPRTRQASGRLAQEQEGEAEYVSGVGEIQAGSVETFLRSDEKLLRPDSLTAADVEEMEEDLVALEDYAGRAEDLEPPEKHEDQHGLLVAAVADLHGAAEIAHRLVTDPASAAQSDYDAYDLLVDEAAVGLRRSNEALGEDFRTVERARYAVR